VMYNKDNLNNLNLINNCLFLQPITRSYVPHEALSTRRPPPTAARAGRGYTSTTSRMSATPASTHFVALALVFSPAVKTKVGPRCCVM